jgi:hypothetical protein
MNYTLTAFSAAKSGAFLFSPICEILTIHQDQLVQAIVWCCFRPDFELIMSQLPVITNAKEFSNAIELVFSTLDINTPTLLFRNLVKLGCNLSELDSATFREKLRRSYFLCKSWFKAVFGDSKKNRQLWALENNLVGASSLSTEYRIEGKYYSPPTDDMNVDGAYIPISKATLISNCYCWPADDGPVEYYPIREVEVKKEEEQ